MGFFSFLKSFWDIIFVFIYLRIIKRIDIAESNTAYSDLQALFMAARDGRGKGAIVEVGAYKGRSTIALAAGSKLAGREKVVSIDPHSAGTLAVFRRNIAKSGLSDQVITVVAVSQAAREKFEGLIRLIFIDGLHDHDSVKNDIELWKDLVTEGGILAFHDYNYSAVHQAVKKLTDSPGYTFEAEVGCTAFISKGRQSNQELFRTIRIFNSLKQVILPGKIKR